MLKGVRSPIVSGGSQDASLRTPFADARLWHVPHEPDLAEREDSRITVAPEESTGGHEVVKCRAVARYGDRTLSGEAQTSVDAVETERVAQGKDMCFVFRIKRMEQAERCVNSGSLGGVRTRGDEDRRLLRTAGPSRQQRRAVDGPSPFVQGLSAVTQRRKNVTGREVFVESGTTHRRGTNVCGAGGYAYRIVSCGIRRQPPAICRSPPGRETVDEVRGRDGELPRGTAHNRRSMPRCFAIVVRSGPGPECDPRHRDAEHFGAYGYGREREITRCRWHRVVRDLVTGRCLGDPECMRVHTQTSRHATGPSSRLCRAAVAAGRPAREALGMQVGDGAARTHRPAHDRGRAMAHRRSMASILGSFRGGKPSCRTRRASAVR